MEDIGAVEGLRHFLDCFVLKDHFAEIGARIDRSAFGAREKRTAAGVSA